MQKLILIILLAQRLFSDPSTLSAADRIQVSGVFFAIRDAADIPAPERGRISENPVRPGDMVAADALLVRLDDETARLNLQQQQLKLARAKAEVVGSQAVQMASAALDEARSEQLQAEKNLEIAAKQADDDSALQLAMREEELAKDELERARTSRELSRISISEQEWFRLQNNCEQARLKTCMAETAAIVRDAERLRGEQLVQQHQATVRRFESLLLQAKTDHESATLELQILQNAVETAQLALERRQIRAPFAGTIVETNRQLGEWVEPGEKLLRLINLKTLHVEGFLTAEQAATVHSGQRAEVQINDSDKPAPAVIVFVSPQIDSENFVRVRAEIMNEHGRYRPGSPADMWIDTTTAADGVSDER